MKILTRANSEDSARRLLGRIALREEAGQSGRAWYRIEQKDNDEAEVYLYDEISLWGVSSNRFVQDLKGLDVETIHLRVNSPGGDVFDGAAIYNAIKDHPARVVTHIDGLAASMASDIAIAGDEVRMAENAFFMIHNPWCLAMGDARDMRKIADLLDKIRENMVNHYTEKSGATKKQIREWCDEETWFTAQEAVEAGFADVVEEAIDVGASVNPEIYGFVNAPAALKREKPADDMTEREFEGFLRDAGFSKTQAAAIVSGGFRALRRGDPDLDAVAEKIRASIKLLKGGK